MIRAFLFLIVVSVGYYFYYADEFKVGVELMEEAQKLQQSVNNPQQLNKHMDALELVLRKNMQPDGGIACDNFKKEVLEYTQALPKDEDRQDIVKMMDFQLATIKKMYGAIERDPASESDDNFVECYTAARNSVSP